MSFYLETALKNKNQTKIQTEYSNRFRDKPLWIKDKATHELEYDRTKGQCCGWHITGPHKKNGEAKPLFDYELQILDDLAAHKYLWIKKARGLGITEFTLCYIVWRCMSSDEWKGKRVCIAVGPGIHLATTLIDRIKKLLPAMKFDTKETVVELNGCKIEAFPSHKIETMRGLTEVKFILIDEGDWIPQHQDTLAAAEGYIPKTDPHIVLISTPNKPENLFEQIERDQNSMYHKIFLPYTVGLHKIYTEEEIAVARQSSSFEREFNLAYIGQEGDVFTDASIQAAINNEMLIRAQWHPSVRDVDSFTPSLDKCMGIDAGFGSSKFGIVVTEFVPESQAGDAHRSLLQVVYAEEFERPSFDDMINRIVHMKSEWNIKTIMIDAANPEVITAIKNGIGERPDFETQISKLKTTFRHVREDPVKHLQKWMSVIPVSFSTEGRSMLGRAKIMLDREWLAIHPVHFHKLIVALRTAQSTDGLLDKTQTSHDDLLDAFRLSLLRWSVD